jgi:hypothetical protein
VSDLAGAATLPDDAARLAQLCGGPDQLDGVLQRHFDERVSWEVASADLTVAAREKLSAALEAARFARMHIGVVPKISARTLGIDLYA